MGMLGKVLGILNILLAIGFISLVAMNYNTRRSWTYAVLKEDLILNGLPVDDTQTDAEGQVLVNLIGEKMQKDLLGGGESKIKTQVDEVKKVQSSLRSSIDNASKDDEKRKLLLSSLLPLAQTEGERQDLKERIQKEKIDDLLGENGPLESYFKTALAGSSRGARHETIAHLLVNLGEQSQNYQQRVMVVVGLRAYAHEVNSQALALQAMVPVVQRQIAEDRDAYVERYQTLIQQILALADRQRDVSLTLEKQIKLRDEHRTLVLKRQEDIAEVNKEIEDAKKATAEALAEQTDLEQATTKAQQGVSEEYHKTERLEKEIRNLEISH